MYFSLGEVVGVKRGTSDQRDSKQERQLLPVNTAMPLGNSKDKTVKIAAIQYIEMATFKVLLQQITSQILCYLQ